MTLWAKQSSTDREAAVFTVGNDHLLDLALVPYDCRASMAHAEMLLSMGILTVAERDALFVGLKEIIALHARGAFPVSVEHEDCHTAIEHYLTAKLGDTGKKIHACRSRNDQVQAALRLFYRDEVGRLLAAAAKLTDALKLLDTTKGHIPMPGYTHMRKAMPSSVGLWAGAFLESMQDNATLLKTAAALLDKSPLGTGAGYGLPLPVDRMLTADLLGFPALQLNSLYVQNSRGKLESSLAHACLMVMADLNKMASDIILFSMPEFGYFTLPDSLCTGSSLMPQKRNPDALELVRAKYHVVLAAEHQLTSVISNLISGYHRDLQLTKQPVMDALSVTISCLGMMASVISALDVDEASCNGAMTPELFAAKEAHMMVESGVPFREAYHRVKDATYL